MKAGTLCCGGNASFMAGYMMYGGRLVICGDSGEQVGQDIHGGTIYVGGEIVDSLGTDAMEAELEPGEEDGVLEFLERYEIPFDGPAEEDRQRRQEPPLPAHRAARPGDPVLRRLGADGVLEREGAGGHRRQGADRPLPHPRLRRRPAAAAPERHRVQARPHDGRARPGRRLQGRPRHVARRSLRREADRPVDAGDDRADELRRALEVDEGRARQGLGPLRHLRQLGRGRADPRGARRGQARRRPVPRRPARLERPRHARRPTASRSTSPRARSPGSAAS